MDQEKLTKLTDPEMDVKDVSYGDCGFPGLHPELVCDAPLGHVLVINTDVTPAAGL